MPPDKPLGWWTARERHRWVIQRRIAGSLNALFGLFSLWIATQAGGIETFAFAVCLLAGGVGLACGWRWLGLILWPLAVLELPALPFGTVLGGYTLWVLYNSERERRANPPPQGRAAA
jgi:hypothetical protein